MNTKLWGIRLEIKKGNNKSTKNYIILDKKFRKKPTKGKYLAIRSTRLLKANNFGINFDPSLLTIKKISLPYFLLMS